MESISWSFSLNLLAKNFGRRFITGMGCPSHTSAAQLWKWFQTRWNIRCWQLNGQSLTKWVWEPLSTKKWRHQVKTMKWAIFFIELFIESIYLQERQHRNGPSISSTQLSSENTFNRVQSTWKSLCVATQWATCLTTWVWELVWTKNGASSQNDKSGQSVSTRVSGPARRMLRKILRAIFLEGRLTAPGG